MYSKIVVFLLWTGLASLTMSTTAAPAAPEDRKKPNILVIWGDDIGQFNVSACPSSDGLRHIFLCGAEALAHLVAG